MILTESGVCCLLQNIKKAIPETKNLKVYCNKEEMCAKPSDLHPERMMVNIKITDSTVTDKTKQSAEGKLSAESIVCYSRETSVVVQLWVRNCGEDKTFCLGTAVAGFISSQMEALACAEGVEKGIERYLTSGSGEQEITFITQQFTVKHQDCLGASI